MHQSNHKLLMHRPILNVGIVGADKTVTHIGRGGGWREEVQVSGPISLQDEDPRDSCKFELFWLDEGGGIAAENQQLGLLDLDPLALKTWCCPCI